MKPNMFRSISRLMMAAVVVSLPLTGMARTKAQAKTPAQAQSQTQGKAPKYIFYYIIVKNIFIRVREMRQIFPK